MNPPLKYQYQYQAPPTPSKLGNSTPSHNTGSGSHGTSALLASLDKSILQIRYCLFALVHSCKFIFNYNKYKWLMLLIFFIINSRDWLTLLEEMQKNEKVDISDFEHICHMLDRQRVSNST